MNIFLRSRSRQGNDVSAIFVHAGAGFHSHQNQKRHLQACNDAAGLGMAVLRAGGSAVDAVEIAIKVLEDREITNAGYGSNLAYDGTVECDATIVDECGRSGAVGAVSRAQDIRNPISLARVVLLRSFQPLSLRRVPPNLLVGEGATDFAFDYGIPVLPHDALVSPSARERWIKWKEDIRKADAPDDKDMAEPSDVDPNVEIALELEEYEKYVRRQSRLQHGRAMEVNGLLRASIPAGVSSEMDQMRFPAPSLALSNADTPMMSSTSIQEVDLMSDSPERNGAHHEPSSSGLILSENGGSNVLQQLSAGSDQAPFDLTSAMANTRTGTERMVAEPPSFCSRDLAANGVAGHDGLQEPDCDPRHEPTVPRLKEQSRVSRLKSFISNAAHDLRRSGKSAHDPSMSSVERTKRSRISTNSRPSKQPSMNRPYHNDLIMDTVGAIAVDSSGRIAAGSSSGGIGMKHRGRVGPAALVGVGTAVIPEDPDDKDKVSVAVVTSGTGEHIATTMAAATCADRLYHSVRSRGAGRMEYVSEDLAMEGVIKRDFMQHPSVKYSTSPGALGILAVKKTVDGIYVYFAHNTDSFSDGTGCSVDALGRKSTELYHVT